MTKTMHMSDLPAHVGETFGPGEPFEVAQEMIDMFADATGDHQWIHVDPDRAKDGPFGTTIAHGFLTLSLVPRVVTSLVDVEGVGMGINYGLDRVRFPAPVPSGSKVVPTLALKDVTELDGGALQTAWEATLTVEGAEKPSCIAVLLARYFPEA
jgi:acyl dehydratase